MRLPLCNSPAYRKQLLSPRALVHLAFYRCNQFFTLRVHLILRIKQRSPLLVAQTFKCLNLFLSGEFFFQRQCGRGGTASFLDLAVEFLDLALQPHLQVICPAIQLVSFCLEEARIALRNITLNGRLALLCNGFKLLCDLLSQPSPEGEGAMPRAVSVAVRRHPRPTFGRRLSQPQR